MPVYPTLAIEHWSNVDPIGDRAIVLKQRPARVDPGRAIAELFPESMRKFGLAEPYGTCEGLPCSRRARATCPHCRGEHCLAHATDGEHECQPQSANAPVDGVRR